MDFWIGFILGLAVMFLIYRFIIIKDVFITFINKLDIDDKIKDFITHKIDELI
jgi:hypothetical protein